MSKRNKLVKYCIKNKIKFKHKHYFQRNITYILFNNL